MGNLISNVNFWDEGAKEPYSSINVIDNGIDTYNEELVNKINGVLSSMENNADIKKDINNMRHYFAEMSNGNARADINIYVGEFLYDGLKFRKWNERWLEAKAKGYCKEFSEGDSTELNAEEFTKEIEALDDNPLIGFTGTVPFFKMVSIPSEEDDFLNGKNDEPLTDDYYVALWIEPLY